MRESPGLGEWRRTDGCGALRAGDAGRRVTLMGWVHARRDHGGLVFVDLRDRSGLVQLVFNPELEPGAHAAAQALRSEFVIAVRGEVARRPADTVNPALATGEVEVRVEELRVLNSARPLPFPVDDAAEVAETTRLRYRYLDLRRPRKAQNFVLRHRLTKTIRDYLDARGFLEVETPVLTRSTPEGARDYLVPSRVNPGRFYALPQSPQLFKQILMVAGFERYFQIVRCFRDEDLRADRQPEFTQLDLEQSFVQPRDIFALVEGLLAEVFRVTRGAEIPTPFPVLPYDEALARYGTDKPDLRFGLEIRDFSEALAGSRFQVFREVIAAGGAVRGLAVDGRSLSRKDLDDLVALATTLGAKGLVWIRVQSEGWQSPVAKFLSDSERQRLATAAGVSAGDVLLLVADEPAAASRVLGAVRLHLGQKLGLVDPCAWRPVWVTDFPLFEWDAEQGRWVAMHHPFTAPQPGHVELLESDPGRVRSLAYDLVLNGTELGGGSIRIHDPALQSRVFAVLGIGESEARSKFGFLLDALAYGAPPHGGIALGLDRLAMFLCGETSIREVIAFPKTQKAVCPLTDAPSEVDPRQLRELSIKLDL